MSQRIPPYPRKVQIKHTVDIQLRRAFLEERWTLAADLARHRHNATKDEYYKAVEVAAKSRCDNAVDRNAGKEIVQAMVAENTIIKDVDALDLYEFATVNFVEVNAEMIGVLRVRLTKALPKDQNAGLKCLEACMHNSDWVHAQEIAVSLNKNFPRDRRFLFHNILTTFLVATSDNADAIKKKLFPNLAKAQVDRAFNLRPLPGTNLTPRDLTEINEGEVELWLRIRQTFGSAQENLELLSRPNWGPLFFLERGLTDAFLRSINLLRFNGQWGEITRVVNVVYDKVISLGQENPNTASVMINEQYIKASQEWFLWTTTVHAAKELPDGQEALRIFRKKVKKVVRILTRLRCMNPVFQKNFDIILLNIAFYKAVLATTSSRTISGDNVVPRLLDLTKKHSNASNCFTIVKGFLEVLDTAKIAEFVGALASEHAENVEDVNIFDKLLLLALKLKVQFFQATSLTTNQECIFCHSGAKGGPDCETCLKDIAECALDAFCAGMQDKDVPQKAALGSEDPLSTFAILGSICLIKLAGADHNRWQQLKESPLYHLNIQLFLQAVVWLDFYLRETPKNKALGLLLVRLHLMMGCVTPALEIWQRYGIKNSLLESLGLVCIDRLASTSPGHFVLGLSPPVSLADDWALYFDKAIRDTNPRAVAMALQSDNYESIVDTVRLARDQGRNCALTVAVVEHRRGLRLKTGRAETALDEIEHDPLVMSLSPDYELQDRTDYDPLPHWAGPQSISIQELTAYGPLPTSRRCHVSILTERFIDLICYVQPKDFKPPKAGQLLQVDWQAAASSCNSLHANLDTLIFRQGHDEKDLTFPEAFYFRTVTQLVKLVKLVLETVLPAASTKAAREDVVHTIRQIVAIVEHQTENFLTLPKGIHAKMHTLHAIAALHAMGMLRDSALVVKYTVQYLGAALDRIKTADKPRGTTEAGWLTPETKKLAAAGTAADARIKERIKTLKDSLNTAGWEDRLSGWVFGDHDGVGQDFGGRVAAKMNLFVPTDTRKVWAGEVIGSWRDVVNGWAAVRFD